MPEHFLKLPCSKNLQMPLENQGVQVFKGNSTNHHEIRLLINILMVIRFTSASLRIQLQTNCTSHALEPFCPFSSGYLNRKASEMRTQIFFLEIYSIPLFVKFTKKRFKIV